MNSSLLVKSLYEISLISGLVNTHEPHDFQAQTVIELHLFNNWMSYSHFKLACVGEEDPYRDTCPAARGVKGMWILQRF